MSSNEDELNEGDHSPGAYQSSKKRRIQRACDICRRKKIRCDGVQMPGNRCSNCIAYNYDCTYIEAAKKRGPPKGYVESLENRVEKLDKLLRRLCSSEAAYKELRASLDSSNWMVEAPTDPSSLVADVPLCGSGPASTIAIDVANAIRGASGMHDEPSSSQPDDDDEPTLILADNLKRMELEPNEYRFFGKSSGAMLIRTALELKNEYTGSDVVLADLADPRKSPMKSLRREFWTSRPWEKKSRATEKARYIFPDPELGRDLIDLYFKYVNLYLPLLHRPTFEKWVHEEMHLTSDNFAPVYLLVCAVGARYSEDPRVLLDGVDSYHSCGWKWFDQVQMVNRSMLSPPTLFDLQVYCLSVQFLQGSSAPQSCWTMVGIGIRLAQDVGAHRRKVHNHTLTPEDELWKRAFWVLVCMDRIVSSSLGRPCAIQDEDFDLDLPIDCDDEYWENPDPEQNFKQPPGKPSLITSFILYIKLHQILAFSLRTIYSINKSKILLGFVGSEWEQGIVIELDSALNKWVSSVPDHLQWDPARLKDDNFFNQSVSLYSAYYLIRILIHRPFIPSPSKPSPLSVPSLTMCTSAARSCSRLVNEQRLRNTMPPPQIQMAVFTSGIVLLLSIWGGKRSGLSMDPTKEMNDVYKCMQVLKTSETRWHSAGRLWDILYELASVGELPLPQASPPTTNKRERDSEIPISATPKDSSLNASQDDMPRNIAGTRRVHKESSFVVPTMPTHAQSQSDASSTSQQPTSRRPSQSRTQQEQPVPSLPTTPAQYYALPVYSNELSRLPLHGQIAFSAPARTQLRPPPPPHQPSYWNIDDDPSDQSIAGPSTNAGNLPPHPLDPRAPHQQSQQPLSQGLNPQNTQQSAGYPPISEMSTMAQGYDMDSTALAAGMMFDAMAGTLGYPQQQQNMYGMNTMDESNPIASSSQDSYRGMSMDTSTMVDMAQSSQRQQASGSHAQHQRQPSMPRQHQSGDGQQQQQDMAYSTFIDNDTIAMWSNAPAGFELDEWGTYLTNVSELTQHGHQAALPGGSGHLPHHASHLNG